MIEPVDENADVTANTDVETAEGTTGADPSNTPVENLTAPLDSHDDIADRVRGVDTTVVEHTNEAMVLRDAATVQREGGLGEGGQVLDGAADDEDAK